MHPSSRNVRLVIFLAALVLATPAAAQSFRVERVRQPVLLPQPGLAARIGLLRDRELRRSLVLLLGAQRGATLDTNAIEDAAVMLVAALGEEGFQKPAVTIKATLADGTLKQLVFDASLETALPRAMEAR